MGQKHPVKSAGYRGWRAPPQRSTAFNSFPISAGFFVTDEAILKQLRASPIPIVFSVGGVFLVPRVIGRCIAVGRRVDEANAWFERAIEISRSCGARVELARSLLDRAKLRLASKPSAEGARRAARDLAEAIPILNDLALRPLLSEALSLQRLVDDGA
jgi:hypothetical protein